MQRLGMRVNPRRRSNASVGKQAEGRVEKTLFENLWKWRPVRPHEKSRWDE
jgi:hypothetical protein